MISFLVLPFPNVYSNSERIGFEFIHDNRINYSIDLKFGPDGNLYISSHYSNEIL